MQKKTFLLLAQNGAFVKSILVELLQILFWLASYSMYILLIVLSHLINSRAIMYIDVVLCLDGLLWVLTLYFGVLQVNQISCCSISFTCIIIYASCFLKQINLQFLFYYHITGTNYSSILRMTRVSKMDRVGLSWTLKNVGPDRIRPIWVNSMGLPSQAGLGKYRLKFNHAYVGPIFFYFLFFFL